MAKMTPETTLPLHEGRSMPVFGLGTWQLTNDTTASIEHALEIGYRMIDTSRDYGTQPEIGEAVAQSGVDRSELYLVTKVEEDDDAYDATERAVDELKQDYVDLVLVHRPPPDGPGVALWEGLIEAREDGLTRDIGVSNYAAGQIRELEEATDVRPVVDQIEWSPFGWSTRMLDWCRERAIVIQAYSPLTRRKRLDDERLRRLGDRYAATPAQIMLRWGLQLGVVPIPKANQGEHRMENLGTFDFTLSEQHMEEVGALNEHYSALGGLPYIRQPA